MYHFRKQKCIFAKKNMKKIFVIFSLFAFLTALSSCGIYKEPCEGVTSKDIVSEKKI